MASNYVAFTDGAYSSARNQGGIGIVILKDNKPILTYNNAYKDTTNNRMEIQAVISALNCVKKPIDSLTIFSDSMYVIGCATLGWKKEKNTDLWEKYKIAYDRVAKLCPLIEFKHVKGHSNSEFNNKVDKLAVEASQWVI